VILICLKQQQAEPLSSRLKGWNLLHQDTEIRFFRKHQNEPTKFPPPLSLSQKNDLIFCNDVCSVIETLGHQLVPTEWRLCIDSSKVYLKLVLLQNGEKFPSVPLAHIANMKDFYENMKLLLEKIQYEKYNRNICGDVKANDLLLGYTKFCCFLCEWNSRDRKYHYNEKDWPKGE